MKRLLKILSLSFAVILLFPATAGASEDFVEDFSQIAPDEKYADFGYLSELFSLEGVFTLLTDGAANALYDLSPRLLLLFGVSVMSVLAALYGGRYKEGVACGIGVITTLISLGSFCEIFTIVTDSMEKVGAFFSSLIPLFSAITLSGGGNYTAAGQSLAMATTVSIFSRVITPLFTVLLSAMLAFSLLSSFGISGTERLVMSMKRNLLLLISAVGAVILATVSLQTLLSSPRDTAAMRAVRHLAGSMLPVVGGTVSASLSALWSGLSLAKGVVGVGGIAAILGMLLSPLLSLLVYRLAIGLFISAEGFVTDAKSPLSRLSDCLDLLIGVYSISSVVYIFEIVLFLKGGVELI